VTALRNSVLWRACDGRGRRSGGCSAVGRELL